MHLLFPLSLAALVTALPSPTLTPRATTTQLCGEPNASQLIPSSPWIVFSMNYNYQKISGSSCATYESTSGTGDAQKIKWRVDWDIAQDSNADLVKGYEFVGLTQNLETRLSEIASIPAEWTWVRSNETAYKGKAVQILSLVRWCYANQIDAGNVAFDFMTSDTKGDSTSSSAQELMIWLRYEGGQLPIGWVDGPVATIDGLFEKDGWKLYQGKNEDTGITVSSLLVDIDNQFRGEFQGDLRDWLVAISKQGVFSEDTYVNVGNGGMEPFYGKVSFENELGLRINLL